MKGLNIINSKKRRIKDACWKIKHFIKKIKYSLRKNIPDPDTIYYINPKRIIFHTNKNRGEANEPFKDRVFDPKKDQGKIIEGNWDLSQYRFTDLDIYKAIEDRVKFDKKWEETEFYYRIQNEINLGKHPWGIQNRYDLDKRCYYIDSLYKSIKENGYQLSRNIQIEKEKGAAKKYSEVMTNIGRSGEYLFEDGRHRLAIAKVLNISQIPIKVIVRHTEWQKFREFVISYANGQMLDQPLIHPDLSDIPSSLSCEEDFEAIKRNIELENGKLLDIGPNLGYFCHKFEDIGYECYAIESSPELSFIMKKLKIAENKKFKIINEALFEDLAMNIMDFDIVLALNTFDYFFDFEKGLKSLKSMLNKIKAEIFFYALPQITHIQNKNEFVNSYDERKFVNLLLENNYQYKLKPIHISNEGTKIYKIYK